MLTPTCVLSMYYTYVDYIGGPLGSLSLLGCNNIIDMEQCCQDWTWNMLSWTLLGVGSQQLTRLFVATLALGLRPRQKGLQGCGPRGSPGVTSHTPGSVGKCEGMNLHTPKATPTLGNGVPVDSQNFRERF